MHLKQFKDLNGVEGGAFEELIAADEKLDAPAVGLTHVLTDATDENIVLTGSIKGHWKSIRLRVVHNRHAGCFRQD